MLRRLTVDNYALIAHLEMELGAHLNIVTGETGAGKSILMGALGLLLGTRGEAGVQGDPGRNCVVEGVFEVGADAGSGASGLRDFFEENDLEWAPEVVVRRVLSVSGKSRAYIGDLPVTLAVLRALGERLIDIHSQHENLLLRGAGFRTSIVDVAAGQIDLVAQYNAVFGEWRALHRQLREARAEAAAARGDEDYLRHQTEELAALKLRAGEQVELETELRALEHADEIREAISLCTSELAADETGILPRLKTLRGAAERIARMHPRAEEFAARLGSTYLELQDLERELSADLERADGDPERLEAVSARLDAIWTLERKHRVETVEELLASQRDFEARLAAIDNSDETLRALEAAAAARFAEASELAARISAGRVRAAGLVSAHVEGILRRLGMPETRFVVEVSPAGSAPSAGSAAATGSAQITSAAPHPSGMGAGESPAGGTAAAGSSGSVESTGGALAAAVSVGSATSSASGMRIGESTPAGSQITSATPPPSSSSASTTPHPSGMRVGESTPAGSQITSAAPYPSGSSASATPLPSGSSASATLHSSAMRVGESTAGSTGAGATTSVSASSATPSTSTMSGMGTGKSADATSGSGAGTGSTPLSATPPPSGMRVGESTPNGAQITSATPPPSSSSASTTPHPSYMGGDGKADAANLRADGADEVRFLFSANPGIAPRAVEKIASGGEISRVMLALKTLSVKALGQPTVVFDEIDAGVSGRVADAMGEVMSELSATCQVVNITHLPQIAAKQGEHFVVYKEGGATKIRHLTAAERPAEIAKMLSGTTVTDAALSQARELLG